VGWFDGHQSHFVSQDVITFSVSWVFRCVILEKPWRVRLSRLVSAVGAERFGPGLCPSDTLGLYCTKSAWMVKWSIVHRWGARSLLSIFLFSEVMPGLFLWLKVKRKLVIFCLRAHTLRDVTGCWQIHNRLCDKCDLHCPGRKACPFFYLAKKCAT